LVHEPARAGRSTAKRVPGLSQATPFTACRASAQSARRVTPGVRCWPHKPLANPSSRHQPGAWAIHPCPTHLPGMVQGWTRNTLLQSIRPHPHLLQPAHGIVVSEQRVAGGWQGHDDAEAKPSRPVCPVAGAGSPPLVEPRRWHRARGGDELLAWILRMALRWPQHPLADGETRHARAGTGSRYACRDRGRPRARFDLSSGRGGFTFWFRAERQLYTASDAHLLNSSGQSTSAETMLRGTPAERVGLRLRSNQIDVARRSKVYGACI